jgi:hypothetical protein
MYVPTAAVRYLVGVFYVPLPSRNDMKCFGIAIRAKLSSFARFRPSFFLSIIN